MQVPDGGAELSDLHVVLLHRRHRLRPVQVHRAADEEADDRQTGSIRDYCSKCYFNFKIKS